MTDLMRAFARAEKLVAGDLGISVEQLRARNRPAPDTEQQPESDDEQPRCARCEHPHDRHDGDGCQICRDLLTEQARCTGYR